MSERGTTNGNARGSAEDRRKRRAWIMEAWASDQPGFVRCYRCGVLLYNPDAPPAAVATMLTAYGEAVALGHLARVLSTYPLTIDRIVPGCQGGTYRRNNIRPACGTCNSETGGATRRKGKA